MSGVTIVQDNTGAVTAALESQLSAAMDAIGAACEGFAKMKCPVDTGRLRNSITHQLAEGGKAVQVGTNVEYAKFVELGTSRMGARPYLKPAAQDHVGEYQAILRNALGS